MLYALLRRAHGPCLSPGSWPNKTVDGARRHRGSISTSFALVEKGSSTSGGVYRVAARRCPGVRRVRAGFGRGIIVGPGIPMTPIV